MLDLMKKKKRRKRKKCVVELIPKQEAKGAFNNVIQKIKLADRKSFFR